MSLSMDAFDDDGPDYSDYEYQQFQFLLDVGAPDGGGEIAPAVIQTVEPLQSQGGLSNDEVAELVYMELQASIEFDDEGADQNVATNAEFRGVFGTDLSVANQLEDSPVVNAGSGSDVIVESTGSEDPADVEAQIFSQSSPEIFALFTTAGGPPFDDQTNGPGGSATHEHVQIERNWRNLTGRGPVLDATDTLSVLARLIISDTIIDNAGTLRGHLVWDVSEMDDAGQRFAVPDR